METIATRTVTLAATRYGYTGQIAWGKHGTLTAEVLQDIDDSTFELVDGWTWEVRTAAGKVIGNGTETNKVRAARRAGNIIATLNA